MHLFLSLGVCFCDVRAGNLFGMSVGFYLQSQVQCAAKNCLSVYFSSPDWIRHSFHLTGHNHKVWERLHRYRSTIKLIELFTTGPFLPHLHMGDIQAALHLAIYDKRLRVRTTIRKTKNFNSSIFIFLRLAHCVDYSTNNRVQDHYREVTEER